MAAAAAAASRAAELLLEAPECYLEGWSSEEDSTLVGSYEPGACALERVCSLLESSGTDLSDGHLRTASLGSSAATQPSTSSETALRGPLCDTASMFIPVAPTPCAMVPCIADELEQELAAEAPGDSGIISAVRATAQHNLAHQVSPHKEAPKEPEFVYRKQYLAAQSASCSEGRQCGKVKGIRFKDAIRNARVVEQQKAPAHSGDWRGCRKSPWCDRETSHRGMCNKKAKVPGTAAWPTPPVVEIQRLSPGKHKFSSFYESQVEPEVKEEEIPAYMGSQALRSNSPASCLQLVKQEPLAGSEHGSATNLPGLAEACTPQTSLEGLRPSTAGDGEAEVTGMLRTFSTRTIDSLMASPAFAHDAGGKLVAAASDKDPATPPKGVPTQRQHISVKAKDVNMPPVGSEAFVELQEGLDSPLISPDPPCPYLEAPFDPALASPSSSLKRKATALEGQGLEPDTPGIAAGRVARKKVPPARLDGAEAWMPRVNRAPKPVAASPPKAPAPPVVTAAAGQHECTQCHAQATPVWRAGPMGPKTLCNACGVRWQKDNKVRRVR